MKPLIEMYIDEAVSHASALSGAMGQAEMPKIMRLLKHIKGTGSNFGFEIISRLASAALKQLGSGDEQLKEAHATVNDLIGALSRLSEAPDERKR